MKAIKFFSLMLVVALLIGACGAAQPAAPAAPAASGDQAASPAAGSDISGEITVLTNRTDLVNTVFPEYATKFNEQYPNVKVNFEAMTDYAGEVKIRLNTKDYGDVLLIPEHGDDHHLASRAGLGGVADQLDAAATGQVQVHQQHIGPELVKELQAGGQIGRHAEQVDIGHRCQRAVEGIAKALLVFDDEN